MSNFISAFRLPNYEDYQDYGQTSCTLKTWPDMWPEEIAAEAGVYRERLRMKEQRFFMEDDEVIRTIVHFRLKPRLPEHILKVALVSLADEQGWEVKNPDIISNYGVSTIFKTS
jgi:hypothetical protein